MMKNTFPARLWRILMLRCRESTELSSRRLDGPLSLSDLVALWVHMIICPPCRRFDQHLQVLRRTLQRRNEMDLQSGPAADNDPQQSHSVSLNRASSPSRPCCGRDCASPNKHDDVGTMTLTRERRARIEEALRRRTATADSDVTAASGATSTSISTTASPSTSTSTLDDADED